MQFREKSHLFISILLHLENSDIQYTSYRLLYASYRLLCAVYRQSYARIQSCAHYRQSVASYIVL